MSEEQFEALELEGTRINKYLAQCGINSRRVADRMIAEGRVEVNGRVIDTPGLRVTSNDFIKVDGKRVTPLEEVVVLLNKPRGYVCSREAQGAIGTVYDLLPPRLHHLTYVGRLDADSEGLLVMTNKGELTQKLAHPTGGIEKEYWVTVDQNFENSVLMQFLRGVRLPEGNAKAKYVCRLSARRASVVLQQGLKRQVRQMFQCLGLRVRKLVRVRLGSLWGGDLEPGSWRFMDGSDIAMLLKNPSKQRKFISASQIATSSVATKDEKTEGFDDDAYVFNPNDFETDEEYDLSPGMCTRYRDADDEEIRIDDRMFDEGKQAKSFRDRSRKRDFSRGGHTSRRDERKFGDDRRERGSQSRRRFDDDERRREGDGRRPRREGAFRERREGGFRGGRGEQSSARGQRFGKRGGATGGRKPAFGGRKPSGGRGFGGRQNRNHK